MQPTGGDVAAFLEQVAPDRRRDDAGVLVELMREVSGREPALWGTIVGFGACRYRYPTGTEGEAPLLAFAPRKTASTVYVLEALERHADDLARLGPHSIGKGCLYLKHVDATDREVLRGILTRSLAFAEGGGSAQARITVTG